MFEKGAALIFAAPKRAGPMGRTAACTRARSSSVARGPAEAARVGAGPMGVGVEGVARAAGGPVVAPLRRRRASRRPVDREGAGPAGAPSGPRPRRVAGLAAPKTATAPVRDRPGGRISAPNGGAGPPPTRARANPPGAKTPTWGRGRVARASGAGAGRTTPAVQREETNAATGPACTTGRAAGVRADLGAAASTKGPANAALRAACGRGRRAGGGPIPRNASAYAPVSRGADLTRRGPASGGGRALDRRPVESGGANAARRRSSGNCAVVGAGVRGGRGRGARQVPSAGAGP